MRARLENSETSAMHPEAERELAHILLVELLAHQFAYPVRWIETQNVILGETKAERIVEVGPKDILTNMMKRTWNQRYIVSDEVNGLRRQILGLGEDLPEIYYQPALEKEGIPDEDDERTAIGSAERPPQEAQNELPTVDSMTDLDAEDNQLVTKAPILEDVLLPASAVVLAIIATKLKRSADQIETTKSINQLVNGRSTLANEIVGDLHAEFANQLPDRTEEQQLLELFDTLCRTHTGTLGKKTSALVGSFVSSKMPGSLNYSEIRDYLQHRWGLGPMRQDAVLLLALPKQPDSRISSEATAKKFLDDIAKAYFKQEGLPAHRPRSSTMGDQNVKVDAKALKVLDKKGNALLCDISEVLIRHLPTGKDIAKDRTGIECARDLNELDLWRNEHGDDYAEGIKPIFDVKKQRLYDSFWNWSSQDIMLLFGLAKEPSSQNAELIGQLSTSIINRSCERSIAQIQYLCSKTQGEKTDLGRIMRFCLHASISSKNREPKFIDKSVDLVPVTTVDRDGHLKFSEIPRSTPFKPRKSTDAKVPYTISTYGNGTSTISERLSSAYIEDLDMARHSGLTFRGRNMLLTGAGRRSIGFGLLKLLLEGGARVTVTTSKYSPETTQTYQALYSRYGAKGSALRVVPFNQGSRKDVEELSRYLVDDWDLDFIIPFAAISENGRELVELDSKSEFAHRLMLTNLLRLIGTIARNKRSKGVMNRPATVIIPLSPNIGSLGNDGLYAESKRGLEPLLSKWKSETWHNYLSIIGVVIGWTRGTRLMDENDVVAQGIEDMGVRTFSQDQMAALIASLMGGRINLACQSIPVVVDLSGGMSKVVGLKDKLGKIRRRFQAEADSRRAIRDEERREATLFGDEVESQEPKTLLPRANLRVQLPKLPDWDQELASLSNGLEGMVDLGRVVVITGFSELGPYGGSRTRWEMEADGILSLEGCIEMSWMMGLIKYSKDAMKDGETWTGWVDATTLAPVEECEIFSRYMGSILEHTGIRKIEPEACDNEYDPERKMTLQEMELAQDLPPFEATPEMARHFELQHGTKVSISNMESGVCTVRFKAGATILLPKASQFNRTVAGQIPTGWSAKRYGIDDDIIQQVDTITLFTLVCTVEALLSSGITDPYELYEHIHLSEVGTCIGSSMGGLSSLRQMHRDRFLGKEVQGDILQETFVNTTGAWVNMLLTSSTGPIKTPVGACATSLESLDTGHDLIVAGKVKVCLVGGVEDFVEDVSYEFGSMNATCDTDKEFAAGRSPTEMSRPMASSRSGFVESQGCGIQVLTTAELALKMGLPIFGVVAYTSMAADKVGRSVPAPGRGILTNARESNQTLTHAAQSPLLDISYRRRLLNMRIQQVNNNFQVNLDLMEHEIRYLKEVGPEGFAEDRYRRDCLAILEEDAKKQEANLRFSLGNQFWKNEEGIAPIRGSLATWGLSIDDLNVASMHGTSTVQNDLNESSVLQDQMRFLGRQEGNLLPCVCQKWLTGHSKGAAGAWMLNGALQMMDSGIIPGNRNADNIDPELRQRSLLHFPNTTVKCGEINACTVTSFGFGQKGSQAILVHPKFLFAAIDRKDYDDYVPKRNKRWQKSNSYFSHGLLHECLVKTKTSPPYHGSDESTALLDPTARFSKH